MQPERIGLHLIVQIEIKRIQKNDLKKKRQLLMDKCNL
jgi:hypothetical protein